MRICFDLDCTLCFPNEEGKDSYEKYYLAEPNLPVIAWLKEKREEGNYIIIHTARRMLTHNGDINAIVEDVGELTENWLMKYDIAWDELVFGKPYADYYIDDKAINVQELEKML